MAETKTLTEEQLWDTIEFATNLYSGQSKNIFQGWYNPFTQNENLIRLNNLPTNTPTLDEVQKELATARFDTTTLQGYSEFLQTFDRIYGKTLDYFEGILAFDLRITCINANGKDYNSKAYKDDLKRVYKFLDKFDYKSEFRGVVRQILKTGVSYNWLRDSVGTYNEDADALDVKKSRSFSLQVLPQDMCMLTGYATLSDGSGAKVPIFDFDMDYFLRSTVDIRLFDPWFMTQFNKMHQGEHKYIPHSQLRGHKGLYVNWTQTSPYYGAWVKFKLTKNTLKCWKLLKFCKLQRRDEIYSSVNVKNYENIWTISNQASNRGRLNDYSERKYNASDWRWKWCVLFKNSKDIV